VRRALVAFAVAVIALAGTYAWSNAPEDWSDVCILTTGDAPPGTGAYVRLGDPNYTPYSSPDCSDESRVGDASTTVIVANQNIPPGTELDPLIDAGAFRVVEVPNQSLVPSAVRSMDELRGQTTAALIYQNEQIPMERLEGIR
jgi:hypothetical protein